MNKKNIKQQKILKRRVGGLLLIIMGGIVGVSLLMGNKKTFSYIETNYKKMYVSSGETLWEISKKEAVNNLYYKKKDIRYIISDIKAINELKTSELFIGQELLIPII